MSFIKKNIWGVGFAVILVGAFGAMFLASKNTGLPSGTAVAKDNVDFTITAQDHVEGATNAKATLIEYADFQCPACKAYFPLVEKLKTDFPNDLRIVYRYFPLRQLHYQAENSAEVAEAAGLQGKFWEMYSLLYENQDKWANTAGKEPFNEYAKKINLDMTKFASDENLSSVKDRINLDLNYGISIGINGTPTFYLNGKKLTNPQSYEEFKSLVTAAIGGVPTTSNPVATSTIQLGS
jgi:protein-disulfide isomerase